jgi:hypothetical protein
MGDLRANLIHDTGKFMSGHGRKGIGPVDHHPANIRTTDTTGLNPYQNFVLGNIGGHRDIFDPQIGGRM